MTGLTGVPQRVRQAIGRSGCSQREFARRIGVDATKLSKSLHGIRRFTPEELTRISGAADVSLTWLLHGTDGAPPDAEGPPAPGRGPAGTRSSAPSAVETGRRRAIILAAVRMIAERGYHATRVSDIAAACGTSTATIHYYFPERASLLRAALRYCVDRALARRASWMNAAHDAHEQLVHMVRLQTPSDAEHRLEWTVWLQVWAEAALDEEIRRVHQDFYAGWRSNVAELIRRGAAEGVLRDDVDPDEAALALTALIDGLAIQVLTAPGDSFVEPMRRTLMDHITRELVSDRPRDPDS